MRSQWQDLPQRAADTNRKKARLRRDIFLALSKLTESGQPLTLFLRDKKSLPQLRLRRPREWENAGKLETELGRCCLFETKRDAICPSSALDCQALRIIRVELQSGTPSQANF